jgi:hypothetical protein
MRLSRGYSINTFELKINKMNKLSRLLLEKSIVGVDINALVEILDATPNPEMAVEIVLGVYEAPEVSETPINGLTKFYTSIVTKRQDKFTLRKVLKLQVGKKHPLLLNTNGTVRLF